MPFHTLRLDPWRGTVELLSDNLRLRFVPEKER